MKRYQELYDTYISPPPQDTIVNGEKFLYSFSPHKNKILGMLNCGWVITQKKQAVRSIFEG
ncbi:MAG: hypothetical protein ACKVG7_07890, partial [Flavobacteriales bacterium]